MGGGTISSGMKWRLVGTLDGAGLSSGPRLVEELPGGVLGVGGYPLLGPL